VIRCGALLVVALGSWQPCLAEAQGEAAERVQAYLNAASRLYWQVPASRYFVPALMKRHGVTERYLLEFVAREPFHRVGWYSLLTVGSPRGTAAFAQLVLDPNADLERKEEIRRLMAGVSSKRLESQALSRALVPLADRIYPWDSAWARDTQLQALRLIARHPVPEALSLFTTCLYHRPGRYHVGPIIEGLGRLQTPEALKELERYWLTATPECRGSDTLAKAIASYGDDGVRVLRRIHAKHERSWWNVLYGLSQAATPLAVQVARQIRDDTNINSRRMALSVEFAAGQPYRTPATLAALRDPTLQEGILSLLASSTRMDGAKRARLMGVPEIERSVRLLALSDNRSVSFRAKQVLGRWRYDQQRAREPIRWLPPNRGLAVGAGQAGYRVLTKDYATVRVVVHLRNHLPRPLHVAFPHAGCRLVVPDGWVVEGPYTPSGVRLLFLGAGQAEQLDVTFRVKPAPFDDRRPARMRLTVTIEPRHYELVEGWTGMATFPPVEVVVPPPLDSADLDHWRAFLAQAVRDGRLSEHGEIRLSRTGGGPMGRRGLGLTVRGNRLSGSSDWLAFPDDLLVLRPDEVRRICAFLLEDDRFANAIQPYNGPIGKYMPSAGVHLESETRRGGCGGFHYTKAFSEGLAEVVAAIRAPRLREARQRLGAPQGGGH